jgi:hypothetical protein
VDALATIPDNDLAVALFLLVEDADGLSPGRLLAVVDLADIEELALDDPAVLTAARLDDAPVVMGFAVLLP